MNKTNWKVQEGKGKFEGNINNYTFTHKNFKTIEITIQAYTEEQAWRYFEEMKDQI